MPSNADSAIENRVVDESLMPIFKTMEFNERLKLNLESGLDTVSYADTKAGIGQLRKQLGEGLRMGDISLDSIKVAFTNHLVDQIIPHWYGTPWSFGGHTAVPNQGKIACGYFISTTLRDMGIKLDRYKLAQKSPIDEAKVISCGAPIYSVVQGNPEKAFEEIKQLTQEGLYFIGFDTGHVGYLLKRNGELFLIHSNYFSPGSVCMEPLKDSRVFKSFSKFHLVDISNNDVLIKYWLDNRNVL
jgi:hypothetical protein